MEAAKISKTLLKRLPLYLDHLKSLSENDDNISATSIANALGLGHVLVRKDLAKIAGEGRRRTGRSRVELIQDIEKYLDCTSATAAVIVGSGSMGQALLDYSGTAFSGLNVLACFEFDPAGKQSESGKPVYTMTRLESFCKCYDVRIGIIAVAAEEAQRVCNALVACGIQAIWNFSPVRLTVPEGVLLQSENFALSISTLRMHLRTQSEATS